MSPREAVVAAAMAWLDTPWHHAAAVKGAGVDCAQLVRAAYVEAGLLEDFQAPAYSIDYMLHVEDERLCAEIEARGGHLTDTPGVGDVVVWRFGRSFSHAGILVAPDRAIHAFRPWGGVKVTPLDADRLADRPRRYYTFW